MIGYGSMIGQMELQNKNSKKLIEQLEKKDKKIEELTDKLLKTMDKYTELHNIIDNAKDYIEDIQKTKKEEMVFINGKELLEILNKEVK